LYVHSIITAHKNVKTDKLNLYSIDYQGTKRLYLKKLMAIRKIYGSILKMNSNIQVESFFQYLIIITFSRKSS